MSNSEEWQLLTAVLEPAFLDRVARALRNAGFRGYTVSEIKGSSREMEGEPDFLVKRIKLEIVIASKDKPRLEELILKTTPHHESNALVIWSQDLLQFNRYD